MSEKTLNRSPNQPKWTKEQVARRRLVAAGAVGSLLLAGAVGIAMGLRNSNSETNKSTDKVEATVDFTNGIALYDAAIKINQMEGKTDGDVFYSQSYRDLAAANVKRQKDAGIKNIDEAFVTDHTQLTIEIDRTPKTDAQEHAATNGVSGPIYIHEIPKTPTNK